MGKSAVEKWEKEKGISGCRMTQLRLQNERVDRGGLGERSAPLAISELSDLSYVCRGKRKVGSSLRLRSAARMGPKNWEQTGAHRPHKSGVAIVLIHRGCRVVGARAVPHGAKQLRGSSLRLGSSR
jgi:hypothetical protein